MESEVSVEMYPKDKFHQTLNEIANHRFVTPDTKEYRQIASYWAKDVQEGFSILGVEESVFFPSGSTAVGMVEKSADSDIDGSMVFKLPPDKTESVGEFIRKVEVPKECEHVGFADLNATLLDNTDQNFAMVLETGNTDFIESEARIFSPSLTEFTSHHDRTIVDTWRSDLISKMAAMPSGQGEKVWNAIRDYLEKQFVHYENSVGGDASKRVSRVEKVISKKIAQEYPEDNRRQQVAKNVIAGERERFHYPTFKEMKEIFNIQTDRRTESENKNVVFYENYMNEPDPTKRLILARDYLLNDAGDLWTYLYSGLSQEVEKRTESRKADVETLSEYVKAEVESGDGNKYANKLANYIELKNNQFHFKNTMLASESPLSDGVKKVFADEMAKSADSAWKEFITALDVDPDKETVDWLKSMIDGQKILVSDGSHKELQAILAYSKSDHLVINPTLIPSRYTGAMFLLSLAHERGHYYINHSGEDLSQFKEGSLVLEEFYAMMEEQIEFNKADPKFKASVRNRDIYEEPIDQGKTIIGNSLPNSNITPSFKPGRVAMVLYNAYNHGLVQLNQSQKLKVVGDMIDAGKGMDEIKNKLEEMSVQKPSLLNSADMNWRKVDN